MGTGFFFANDKSKRRTSVAILFPNEALPLRLVTTILQATSEDWDTATIYLNLKTREPAPANPAEFLQKNGRSIEFVSGFTNRIP